MSRRRAAPGPGAVALALALGPFSQGCAEVRERTLPLPIPLSYAQGGALYAAGVATPTPAAQCQPEDLPQRGGAPVLIDVGTPLSAFREGEPGPDQLHAHGQVLLYGDGAPRLRLCDLPLIQTRQVAEEWSLRWGDASLRPEAILGGNVLVRRFSLRLSFGREPDEPLCARPPCLRIDRGDIANNCQLAETGEAVFPFRPAGGEASTSLGDDVLVQVGDNLLKYPATRVTIGACLEPLARPERPSTEPDSCLPCNQLNQSRNEAFKAASLYVPRAGATPRQACEGYCQLYGRGKQLEDLAALCMGNLSCADTPAGVGEACAARNSGPIQCTYQGETCTVSRALLEDLIEPGPESKERLRDPYYARAGVDARLLVSTALPGLLLSRTLYAHLRGEEEATRLLADASRAVPLRYPGLPEETAYRTTIGHKQALALALVSRERFLSPCAELARSRRQRLALPWHQPATGQYCQSCLRSACLINLGRDPTQLQDRCGFTGMNNDQVTLACDDASAPVAAVIEMEEPLEALVVPDGAALLRAVNADLRTTTAQADGILGVSVLERLQAEIDLVAGRVIAHCRCGSDPARCRAYRRITYKRADDSCAQGDQISLPAQGEIGHIPIKSCL